MFFFFFFHLVLLLVHLLVWVIVFVVSRFSFESGLHFVYGFVELVPSTSRVLPSDAAVPSGGTPSAIPSRPFDPGFRPWLEPAGASRSQLKRMKFYCRRVLRRLGFGVSESSGHKQRV